MSSSDSSSSSEDHRLESPEPLHRNETTVRPQASKIVWSDIQILQRALNIAVECTTCVHQKEFLTNSFCGLGISTTGSMLTPAAVQQQRMRAVSHYRLLVQVLSKKCDLIGQLTQDALEVQEKFLADEEESRERRREKEQDAGAFEQMMNTIQNSEECGGFGMVDPTLFPPGMEQEDYREEICYLDSVAAKNVGGGAISHPNSGASGFFSSALNVPGHWSSTSPPDNGVTRDEKALRSQKLQWIVDLYAKLNVDTLPLSTVVERCGLGRRSRKQLQHLLEDFAATQANQRPNMNMAASFVNPTLPNVSFFSSTPNMSFGGAPASIHSLGVQFSSVNPLLFLHPPTSGASVPGAPSSPSSLQRSFPNNSARLSNAQLGGHSGLPNENPAFLGQSFCSAALGGPLAAVTLPGGLPHTRFSLRVFFSTLYWNIALLLSTGGQVEECARWLSVIDTEELWELVREMEEPPGLNQRGRDMTFPSPAAQNAVPGSLRLGTSNYLRPHSDRLMESNDGIAHSTVSGEGKGDDELLFGWMRQDLLEVAPRISWRALMASTQPHPTIERIPLSFLRPGAHMCRMLRRIESLRDLSRLVLSAAESFEDVVAVMTPLHHAIEDQRDYLIRTTVAKGAQHPEIHLDHEWKRAGERHTKTVGEVLLCLHTIVEYALAARGRYLLRRRLIQEGTYATTLRQACQLDSAFGTSGGCVTQEKSYSSTGSPSESHIKGLEEDAVRAACGELIRRLTRCKCQSVYELYEVGIPPGARYLSPRVVWTNLESGMEVDSGPPSDASDPFIDPAIPNMLASCALHIVLQFSSTFRSSRVYQSVSGIEEENFSAVLASFVLAYSMHHPLHESEEWSSHKLVQSESDPFSQEPVDSPSPTPVPALPVRGCLQASEEQIAYPDGSHARVWNGGSGETITEYHVDPHSRASQLRNRGSHKTQVRGNARTTSRNLSVATSSSIPNGFMGRVHRFVFALIGRTPSDVSHHRRRVAEARKSETKLPKASPLHRPHSPTGGPPHAGSTRKRPSMLNEQLFESYRLFSQRYATLQFDEKQISTPVSSEIMSPSSPGSGRSGFRRRQRWVSPPPATLFPDPPSGVNQVSSKGGSPVQVLPAVLHSEKKQDRAHVVMQCCRQALGILSHSPPASPAQSNAAALKKLFQSPCRVNGQSYFERPASERLSEMTHDLFHDSSMCIKLPTRGWIPLLPEETVELMEKEVADQLNKAVETPIRPSVLKYPIHPVGSPSEMSRAFPNEPSFLSKPSDAGQAQSDAGSRHSSRESVSLRLLAMFYHIHMLEEVESIPLPILMSMTADTHSAGGEDKTSLNSQAHTVTYCGANGRALSPSLSFVSGNHDLSSSSGLELIPPTTVAILATELNKALYLLPQRIRKLPGAGETWYTRWVEIHQQSIRRYYSKALRDVFVMEEADLLEAARVMHAASDPHATSKNLPLPLNSSDTPKDTVSWWRSQVVRAQSSEELERKRSLARAASQEQSCTLLPDESSKRRDFSVGKNSIVTLPPLNSVAEEDDIFTTSGDSKEKEIPSVKAEGKRGLVSLVAYEMRKVVEESPELTVAAQKELATLGRMDLHNSFALAMNMSFHESCTSNFIVREAGPSQKTSEERLPSKGKSEKKKKEKSKKEKKSKESKKGKKEKVDDLAPTAMLSVLWDSLPVFLPEVRLDVAFFTRMSITTQESMKRTAFELTAEQAAADEEDKQLFLADVGIGTSLLESVIHSSAPSPQQPKDTDGSHSASKGLKAKRRQCLCMLSLAERHMIHNLLPTVSQFFNWKMFYHSSTHGSSIQTLYQCCEAEAAHAAHMGGRSSKHVPMLLLLELMPSTTLSFERDGPGVQEALDLARTDSQKRGGMFTNFSEVKEEKVPNRMIIGAYLTDLLSCQSRRYFGGSECFLFQVFIEGSELAAQGPRRSETLQAELGIIGRSPEMMHAEHLPEIRLFRSSKKNNQFINCRKGSILIGGTMSSTAGDTAGEGGPGAEDGGQFYTSKGGGSALFIDSTLSRGATASCSTFDSPPLTEFDCDYSDCESVLNVKSFEIVRVEAISFEN